jgi:MoaA/NifB/PqqE/SkfB family radical SAM enzyme
MLNRDYPHITLDTATNGILFNGCWEEVFIQSGDCVNFSINSTNPETYSRIVQFGKYESVVKNIQSLIRRKRETDAKVVVRISTVVIDETVEEIPDFIQWAVDHGLDQALFNCDGIGTIRHPDPAKVQRKIAEAYEIADRNPNFKLIHLDDFDWYYAVSNGLLPVRPRKVLSVEKKPCHLAFDALFVNYQGTVRPCCKSWFPFGNLVNDTLAEVWNSRNATLFRRRMARMDFRDCQLTCDLNANPTNESVANLRRAYWVFRRDPKGAGKKLARKLGLSNAQLKLVHE